MTQWRDARLNRALESAPDAGARPSDAARRAIRAAAVAAVAPKPDPWWMRWWTQPQQRMPWNAAFATVLVAVLVGVMWQGEEIPDAQPQAARSKDMAVAPAPAPTVAEPAQRPQPVASVAAPAPAPAPQRAPVVAAPPPAAPVVPPPVTAQPAPAVPPPPALAKAERAPEAMDARKSVAGEQSANRAREAEVQRRDQAADSLAGAAPPPAAPMAAAAGPSARAARAERLSQFAQGAEPLRIEVDGRAAVVQSTRLAQLAEQLARRADSDAPLASAVLLKIEMRGGVLEVTSDQVRWTAPGQSPRTGRPDAGVIQELREEASRAVAR
jgi:hypothetical protein